MAQKIVFGEIEGIEEDHLFLDRREMMNFGFHRKWAAGIDGNRIDGAAAIVLSGGYEDDFDNGDEIVYTGAGGNDPASGKQIKDQDWDNLGNAGLLKNRDEGLPVRVVRGYKHNSPLSPKSGYKYAGLYSVTEAWEETGKSGYKICRFRLNYNGNNISSTLPIIIDEVGDSGREVKRSETTFLRIIRESKIVHQIKELYSYKCQVCDVALKVKSGYYAEGAHIRPLGDPHNGDDNVNNLLCLCPNHHVLFDRGSFAISDDLQLIGGESGSLSVMPSHEIETENLKYHRNCYGYD